MDPDTETSPDEMPTLTQGRWGALPAIDSYAIEREIGSGGFARIYKARDAKTGRTVALKMLKRRVGLSEEIVRRFLREARALASIDHGNVVRIYHVIDQGGLLGLSMEFIEGRTLAQRLEEEGPLSAAEVARIGVALCRALARVHQAGFIHRDVKAENVMQESDAGRIVLMDFGVTRSVDPTSRITGSGALIGTPLAMAPEQFQLGELDERTDIYALGSLLYFLASGRYAVTGRTIEEIGENVVAGSAVRLSEVRPDFPAPLVEIIHRAMNVDPRERFQSAPAMESCLQEWRESQTTRFGLAAGGSAFRITVIALLGAILVTLLAILIRLSSG